MKTFSPPNSQFGPSKGGGLEDLLGVFLLCGPFASFQGVDFVKSQMLDK